jgi:Sigma-70 region 2
MNDYRGIGRSNRLSTLLAEEDDVAANGRAFITLFLKSQRRIFAYILTLLPHQADAEDVLQEVSVTLWERFDENDPPEDFISWGCRIAYHNTPPRRLRGVRAFVASASAISARPCRIPYRRSDRSPLPMCLDRGSEKSQCTQEHLTVPGSP